MKKKKKQSCSCTPQYDACKTVEPCKKTQKCEICKPCETVVECTPISSCKPCPTEKKPMNSYMECPCGDYEITCVDKCVELAKKAEELFVDKIKINNSENIYEISSLYAKTDITAEKLKKEIQRKEVNINYLENYSSRLNDINELINKYNNTIIEIH